MALSQIEHEELTEILQVLGAERKQFGERSRNFIDDQIKRHDEYGAGIRLSPAQWSWLRDLYEKATDV